ncbi:MAG TPA: hypothetical protein VII84_07110 [Acidimicrobiales bacterium]
MRKFVGRTVLSLAMVVSVALVAPMSAGAKSPYPATIEQYLATLRAYNHAIFEINLTLHQSIQSARAIEFAALRAAKTEADKYLARTDFYETRATDITNWQTALKNLGPPPQPPAGDGLPTLTTTTSTTVPAPSRSAFQAR